MTNTEIIYICYKAIEIYSRETMIIDVKAEQRSYIKFCFKLAVGKTSVQTKELRKQRQCVRTMFRALVYRGHKRFTDKLLNQSKNKEAKRPSIITEEMKSAVLKSLKNDTRQTVLIPYMSACTICLPELNVRPILRFHKNKLH